MTDREKLFNILSKLDYENHPLSEMDLWKRSIDTFN